MKKVYLLGMYFYKFFSYYFLLVSLLNGFTYWLCETWNRYIMFHRADM